MEVWGAANEHSSPFLRTATSATSTADQHNEYEIDVRETHRLMGWMVRHCARVLTRFQIKSDGRTACRNTRDKENVKGARAVR